MTRAKQANRKSRRAVRAPATNRQNRLRIIGGRWRGVPISFPDHIELRPSPDRVRETLFNWLAPIILDARCLDLFAGSGALGIEALSRGAAAAVFVERAAKVAQGIQHTLQRLAAQGATVLMADARQYLDARVEQPFDIVFLDPPYSAGLLQEACAKLAANGWLAPSARVYLESPAQDPLPRLPVNWVVQRSRQAGQVGYHLLLT